MKVCILISIPDPKYFDNCTMVFKTLRVGYPTASVHVTVNGVGREEDQYKATSLAGTAGANYIHMAGEPLHHGAWIRDTFNACSNDTEPLVILDGDIHFWKSCEDWKFTAPLAGFYMPEIWNVWSNCRSVPRLHTSHLWFTDPKQLAEKIGRRYPRNDEYSPCDPFMPETRFINGEPLFWDTCSNLYNMVGGFHFGQEHLACYEHLNSAGFVEKVAGLMGGKTGEDFKMFHRLAPHDPELARTFGWPMVKHYLKKKQFEAAVAPEEFRSKFDRMKWLQ